MDAVKLIQENWQWIFTAIGVLVTAISAIVKLSPSTKDDEIWGKCLKFLELFSVFDKKTHE